MKKIKMYFEDKFLKLRQGWVPLNMGAAVHVKLVTAERQGEEI